MIGRIWNTVLWIWTLLYFWILFPRYTFRIPDELKWASSLAITLQRIVIFVHYSATLWMTVLGTLVFIWRGNVRILCRYRHDASGLLLLKVYWITLTVVQLGWQIYNAIAIYLLARNQYSHLCRNNDDARDTSQCPYVSFSEAVQVNFEAFWLPRFSWCILMNLSVYVYYHHRHVLEDEPENEAANAHQFRQPLLQVENDDGNRDLPEESLLPSIARTNESYENSIDTSASPPPTAATTTTTGN